MANRSQMSPKVSEILAFSKEEAMRLASVAVGPEHMMLGILREKNSPVKDFLTIMDIDMDNMKESLVEKIKENNQEKTLASTELYLNEQASNILKLAVLEARVQHTQIVDEQHLLLAMLHDQADNGVKSILEMNNMTYNDALAFFQKKESQTKDGIDFPEEDEDEGVVPTGSNNEEKRTASQTQTKKTGGKTPVIDAFATDLTQAARDGKLDPVVGRVKEMQRVVEILCRRKKNNPILIGEPGVGKSAIVEGLAQMIAKRQTSPVLFGKRVVNLDLTGMVAGTKYRGQFEERIKALLKELEQNPDIIVFIDEIHTLIGAGGAAGAMDAANIMKPALARGTIQCIGATTLDEYRNSIEKDGALERRFQKVLVEPTTAEETLEILHNIKDRYEDHHHVTYTDEALTACVKLTERYITDRAFPDKAIDAMDEVGSRIHLQHAEVPEIITRLQKQIEEMNEKKHMAVKKQNFEMAISCRDEQTKLEQELERQNKLWSEGNDETRDIVTEEAVADVVSMTSGVPVQRMAESEGALLSRMAEELKASVVAQDKAIEKMVKAIQRNRVGLKEPNHPIGAFMFLGPTGVGKTYLAKKLAEQMFGSEDALIRIDMSEYSESFNTSRQRIQHAAAGARRRSSDRWQRSSHRLPQHGNHNDQQRRNTTVEGVWSRSGIQRWRHRTGDGREGQGICSQHYPEEPLQAVLARVPQPSRRDNHLRPARPQRHKENHRYRTARSLQESGRSWLSSRDIRCQERVRGRERLRRAVWRSSAETCHSELYRGHGMREDSLWRTETGRHGKD